MEDFLDYLANLTAQGHADAAREQLAPYADEDPLRYHLGLASIAAAANDLEGLQAAAEAATAIAPEHPLTLQARAMAALLGGDHEAAEAFAREALALDDSARSWRGLAQILWQIGKLEEAERVARELVARWPEDAHVLKLLGRIRARRGDEAGALSYFAKAFAARPEDMEAVELAIALYRDAGWAIGALTLSRITRQGVHPPEVKVLLDLIALLLMERISPDFPGREAFDATIPAVEGLVAESAPLAPRVQLRVARALVDAKRAKEALALLGRVAGRVSDPHDKAELHYVRGLAHEEAGDEEAALEEYEAAVREDEGAWEAACNAVHLALKADALDRAGAVLRRVPEPLKRLRPQLLFNEAVWLLRSGRREEAHAHGRYLRTSAPGLMDELIDELFADEEEAP